MTTPIAPRQTPVAMAMSIYLAVANDDMLKAEERIRQRDAAIRAEVFLELADALETSAGSLHHMTPGEQAGELRRRARALEGESNG